MKAKPVLLALALAAPMMLGQANASGPRLDAAAALEKSEAATGKQLGDRRLFTADGSTLNIADLRGRPLVVNLVYTSCSSVCPVTTQSLKRAVSRARKVLGENAFAVLTVGFDARNDTPERLAAFANVQDIDGDPLWHVASADADTLERLIGEVGFSYSAAAGGFEHVAQTTIVDADGYVRRQVYGDDFPIQMFVEPLKGLVFGTKTRSYSLSDLSDRVRFLCTVYDPKTGRYRTDYAVFIGITLGAASLILMGWVIVRLLRGNRRHPASRAEY